MLLVAAFPLLVLKKATACIIVWGILSLIIIGKEKTFKNFKKSELKHLGILSMYYIFLIINCLLSGFDKGILKFLETDASFLVFPLFMFLNRDYISRDTLQKCLTVFFISNVLLAIWSWRKILSLGFFELQEKNHFYNPVFRNIFSEETNIHLPYLGLLFVFSIFIGIFWLTNKKYNPIIKVVVSLCCLVLLLSITVFSARMSLVTFVLVGCFLFVTLIKNWKLKIILSIFLVGGSLYTVMNSPIKKRFQEMIETKWELPSDKQNDKEHTVNFRYGVYHCALQIIKTHFWFGVGKHKVTSYLDNCYDTFTFTGTNDFKKVTYNSHNQYLDMLLSYGIFGCLFLVFTIFYGVYKTPHKLYLVFMTTVALALLTENLFDRQIGVMFFTFFNTLFFITNYKTAQST